MNISQTEEQSQVAQHVKVRTELESQSLTNSNKYINYRGTEKQLK